MEARRQNAKDPKESASAGSKTGTPRKESGNEASTSNTQSTASTQGKSPNEGVPGKNAGQNAGEQDLLQHAKQATGEIVNQVQQRAGSQLTTQKEGAAKDLTKVVEAVRRFGESLTGEESGPIARYAAEYGDKAADSLERLSTYIREQDPKKLLNDVQSFGRRQPALLLGGAFLLGFAGARLIKSSMDAASQQSFQGNGPASRPSTTNVSTPKPANAPAARPSTSPNAL